WAADLREHEVQDGAVHEKPRADRAERRLVEPGVEVDVHLVRRLAPELVDELPVELRHIQEAEIDAGDGTLQAGAELGPVGAADEHAPHVRMLGHAVHGDHRRRPSEGRLCGPCALAVHPAHRRTSVPARVARATVPPAVASAAPATPSRGMSRSPPVAVTTIATHSTASWSGARRDATSAK